MFLSFLFSNLLNIDYFNKIKLFLTFLNLNYLKVSKSNYNFLNVIKTIYKYNV